jgi:hypothetical protein
MRIVRVLVALLCVLVSMSAAVQQFGVNHLTPSAISTLALSPLLILRPRWFKASCSIPLITFGVLLIDAYALRHRIAVEYRCFDFAFDITEIEKTFLSPSGNTTVYLVKSGFSDSTFWVYLCAGGLFPEEGYLSQISADAHRRNLVIGWKDAWFYFGEQFISFVYNESSGETLSYPMAGAAYPHEPVENPSLESFDQRMRQTIGLSPNPPITY